MFRYVILTHDHPFPHWDLLLEWGETCRTWRLLEEPAPGKTVAAEILPDHRRHYLDYEGPVSGGRGRVTRWDGGTYRVDEDRQVPQGGFAIQLQGQKEFTVAVLRQGEEGICWMFQPANDCPPGDQH